MSGIFTWIFYNHSTAWSLETYNTNEKFSKIIWSLNNIWINKNVACSFLPRLLDFCKINYKFDTTSIGWVRSEQLNSIGVPNIYADADIFSQYFLLRTNQTNQSHFKLSVNRNFNLQDVFQVFFSILIPVNVVIFFNIVDEIRVYFNLWISFPINAFFVRTVDIFLKTKVK